MYRVGLNTAITLYRKNKRVIRGEDYSVLSELKADEEYDNTKDLQINWLYEKIEYFTEIEKALILLYLEDKKYTEIKKINYKLYDFKSNKLIKSGSIKSFPALGSTSSSLYANDINLKHIKERLNFSLSKKLYMHLNLVLRRSK